MTRLNRTDKYRPLIAGISCGHPNVSAGTLGSFIYLDGEPFIISNSHVLACSGMCSLGDPILQPGPYDDGEEYTDTIGHLNMYEGFMHTEPNKIDFAMARPTVEFRDAILGLNEPTMIMTEENYIDEPSVGERVVKSGRSTGITIGKVTGLAASAEIDGYPQGSLIFEDLIIVEGNKIVSGGDSGSVCLTESGKLIGLLFAGSMDGNTYMVCKMSNVIDVIERNTSFKPKTYEFSGLITGTNWIKTLSVIAFGGLAVYSYKNR